jgi:hypothetical protein
LDGKCGIATSDLLVRAAVRGDVSTLSGIKGAIRIAAVGPANRALADANGAVMQDFNPPWTATWPVSPDHLWRIAGPWVGTGGNELRPALAQVTQTSGGEPHGSLALSVSANVKAGSELQSLRSYGYGDYQVRMKVTNVAGVVASFFWVEAPKYGPHEWDIEFLTDESWINSANVGKVHLTLHPSNTTYALSLPFNPSRAFHTYGFDWMPGKIVFTVDGSSAYTFNNPDLTTTKTGYIMANTWTGNPDWGGGPPARQATTVYRWMKYTPH